MLFVDTEFNGFGGQLLSMGICSDKHNHEFYAAIYPPKEIHPWVKEHVMPLILVDYISYGDFQHKLVQYLMKHADEVIVADWAEDLSHLLQCLVGPNGFCFKVFPKLQLINSGKLYPKIPHNAISDARALRDWYEKEQEKNR